MLFSKHIQKQVSKISIFLILVMVANVLAVTADWYHPSREALAITKMYLFLASATVPDNWTEQSSSGKTFYQKFPRGSTTFGAAVDIVMSDTHSHTISYSNCSGPQGGGMAIGESGSAVASDSHTHTSIGSSSMDSATSLPPYRELQVISYNSGVPSSIPTDAVAIFATDTPASGWTRYSAQDNYFIRGGPSGYTTGGSAAHGHNNVSVTTGGPSSSTVGTSPNMTSGGTSSHTHTGSDSMASDDGDHTPPNVNVLLYEADSLVSIPVGTIAMFDGTLPAGWTTLSGNGGIFYEKYLEATSSYAQDGGGADKHSHDDMMIYTTSGPSATSPHDPESGSPAIAIDDSGGEAHDHDVTVSFGDAYNRPVYVKVIFAIKNAYTPETKNWRWFDAEDTADPGTTNGGDTTTGDALAAEDTKPTNTRIVHKGNAVKLRIVIGETAGTAGTDVKFWLQYDTTNGFLSPTTVGVPTGITALWRYYDGNNVTDDATIGTIRLSGSPSAGRHNEDSLTGTGEGSDFTHTASTDFEVEFTIQNYNGSTSTDYYFRVQYEENSTDGIAEPAETVALGSGEAYPSIKCAAANDLEVSAAPANVQLGTYTWGGSGTLTYVFVASEEIVFWDKRGTGVAYDATVSSMSLSSGGDTIPGTDITWTSTAADPPDEAKALKGSFASDRTGTIGNNGQTLDANRDAYQAGTTTLPEQTRRGGFFFLPTMAFGNLEDRDAGDYNGDLVITVI